MVPPKQIVKLSEDDVKYLEKLPKPQQLVLDATRTLVDPTYKSLAEHFGWPQGTVKSRLSRARAALVKLKRRDIVIGEQDGSYSGAQEGKSPHVGRVAGAVAQMEAPPLRLTSVAACSHRHGMGYEPRWR